MVKNYIFSCQKIEQQEVFDLNYFSVNFVSIQRSNSLFFEPEKKIVVLYNSNCLSSYGNCTSYYCSLFVSVLKKALNGEGTQKVSSPFCFLKNATWGNWDELEKLNNSILEFGTYVASISDTSVNLGKNLGIICMFEKHQFVSLQVKLQNKASLKNVLKS